MVVREAAAAASSSGGMSRHEFKWRSTTTTMSHWKTFLLLVLGVFPNRSVGDPPSSDKVNFNGGFADLPTIPPTTYQELSEKLCPKNIPCTQLQPACIRCNDSAKCVYGKRVELSCVVIRGCNSPIAPGMHPKNITVIWNHGCRYCWSVPFNRITCVDNNTTKKGMSPVLCQVKSDVECMGRRKFYRNVPNSKRTGGYRWSTAFLLSVCLGGFGADRFYLGMWQSALGKLFSFGGLGIWTIVDVILIGTGYVRPHDNSLYLTTAPQP